MKPTKLTSLLTAIATAATLSAAPVAADTANTGEVTEYYSGGPDIRFKVRNLRMWVEGGPIGEGEHFSKEKATNTLRSPALAGKTVTAEIEYFHDCQRCGGAINQILIGVVGTETPFQPDSSKVAACIFNGSKSSGGWKTARFQIELDNAEEDYDVRVRYAQHYNCNLAMKTWWKIDPEKKGPRKENTVGTIDTTP